MANPFETSGNWYKGNLHCHTTRSDGRVTPDERVRDYAEHGYDFLALTDHERVTTVPNNPTDMTLITGGEFSAANPWGGPGFHVVGLGVPSHLLVLPDMAVQEVLDAIRQAGGIAIVAHPYWCGLTMKDFDRLDGFVAIEIFNTDCMHGIGKGLSTVHWDNLLASGWKGWGIACDDAHFADIDTYGGWIMVKAPSKSPDDILAAITDGTFYATTGPTIHSAVRTAEGFSVECSEVDWVTFIADRSKGCRVCPEDGSQITSASMELRGSESYVRIECVSRLSGTAWTNPFFID